MWWQLATVGFEAALSVSGYNAVYDYEFYYFSDYNFLTDYNP